MILTTWIFIWKTKRRRQIAFLLAVILVLLYLSTYSGIFVKELNQENEDIVILPPETNTEEYPILIWWTPFTPNQRIIRSCSAGNCLITHSRRELNNTRTEAVIFYGSDLKWTDLPLPRDPRLYWALLHEESPKNNWGFATDDGIALFNITSTPSRLSSYPLVTQYLEDLQNLMAPMKTRIEDKSKGERGLVMYLHSDCDPPSDRDSYVSELMKYVQVDSFGKCLHNKDLPEGHLRDPLTGMDSEDLLDIISQYKFTLAMENAICNDYITEKFWRPFYAGSVPVVKGSPMVKDWAPSEHSIILIDDFKSPKELAEYLLYLDKNDDEYIKYLEYKHYGITNLRLLDTMNDREWRVNDYSPGAINHIDGFECFVCNKAIEKRKAAKTGTKLEPLIASRDHYDCEFPKPLVKRRKKPLTWWTDMLYIWRQVAVREKKKMAAITVGIREGKSQDDIGKLYDSVKVTNSSEYRLTSKDYIID
ncbi:PREDICTED: alpha-(1,3)-fucosyltransferase 11-like [Amphimedon queenslandica]|uniref:Fucosyltransferase n=1 Tax=Amphimedon queenslandica TaxID=400682 RepID=A0A1X7UZ89_AMPQE|nr:PREDICTED: alpha-(1,3)-fucosyltransferase 11-like [Amphimedon queenslandica]|eukprot:XP_011403752.1 PREDICTED: alpha-(1,3)-fucosyltransferase 11-like [Amphimedon queenslandica]